MDDLQKIEPIDTLEILSMSENRKVFRDGDDLVPAPAGLVELHVRKPGGKPFTVYVTDEVLEQFVFPKVMVRADTELEEAEAEEIRSQIDLASADPDFRVFLGSQRHA
jgi:hypothetical protein